MQTWSYRNILFALLLMLGISLQAAVLDGLDEKGGKLDTAPEWNGNFSDRTVGHLMIQAGQAFNNGDLRGSLENLQKAKRRLPLSEEIKLATAHVLARLGKYDEALDEIYSLLDASPKNAGYLRLVGFCLEQLGKYDEAITMYDRLARVAKTSEKPHIYLGAAYYQKGDIDKAIAAYEKAVEINPEDASTLEALGAAWYQTERYDEAIDVLKKAISADPEFAEAYNTLGTVYFSAGEKKQGMLQVRRAIQLNPRMAQAYNNLAGMYALEKDPMTALELLVISLDLDLFSPLAWANTFRALGEVIEKPENWKMPEPDEDLAPLALANWHYNQATKYTKGKDLLKAFQHLLVAIQNNPGADTAYNRAGVIISQSNFPGMAMHFYRMALAMNPSNKEAQQNLQRLVGMMDEARFNRALSNLTELIKENPENANAHYQLAMLHASNNKLTNAIPHLIRTVQIQPDYIPARINLSQSLHTIGQFDAALEAMLSSFQVDIRNIDAWLQLLDSIRLMLPQLKDWELPLPETDTDMTAEEYAAWHFRKAFQYDATDTNSWVKTASHLFESILKDQSTSEYFDEMGLILEKHISVRLAEPFFRLAAEIDPESETIKQHVESSQQKALIESLDARRASLLHAIQQYPENPDNYVQLAILYAENKNVQLAIPELTRALKIDPKHSLGRLTLARALHVTGKTSQSIKVMQSLLEDDPGNPFFKHRIAWLILDSKDAAQLDLALTMAQEACDTFEPETPANFYRTLAQVYFARKDPAQAVRTAVKAARKAQASKDEVLARAILEEAKTYKAAMTP